MSKFPERLKELRLKHGLSQKKLADVSSISKSSINMYERGEREPDLDLLAWFSVYFGVSTDYLLGQPDKAEPQITPETETLTEETPLEESTSAYTGAERFTAVVELAKLTAKLMQASKRRPDEILRTVGEQLEGFGVTLPDSYYAGALPTEAAAERSRTVAAFLEDLGTESLVGESVGAIYAAYVDHCRSTGCLPIGSTYTFGREMARQTGLKTKTTHRNGKVVRVYAD